MFRPNCRLQQRTGTEIREVAHDTQLPVRFLPSTPSSTASIPMNFTARSLAVIWTCSLRARSLASSVGRLD